MECVACQRDEKQEDVPLRLHKCPICFRYVCEDCAERSFGRLFCSKRCSDGFFFGDDDE
jgi:hypothetical protein